MVMKLNACAHEFWVQVDFKIEVSGIGTGAAIVNCSHAWENAHCCYWSTNILLPRRFMFVWLP